MWIVMRGQRTWVWDFPGTETELWGEWRERFSPVSLDPAWGGPARSHLGRVIEVSSVPDGVVGTVQILGPNKATLTLGGQMAPLGRRPKRAPDPVLGPLVEPGAGCPHVVRDGALVELSVQATSRPKVVRALLAHTCIRTLQSLTLGKVDRLGIEAMLTALETGGPLPSVTRLRWRGDLTAASWQRLAPLLPALTELCVAGVMHGELPEVTSLQASAATGGAQPSGLGRLTLTTLEVRAAPPWWGAPATLVLETVPRSRAWFAGLALFPTAPRLGELQLHTQLDPARFAGELQALIARHPSLSRVVIGAGKPGQESLTREAIGALVDAGWSAPPWTRAGLTAALETLRQRDPGRDRFGARHHDYALLPPLAEPQLRAAEEAHGVTLPADYRHYLTSIAGGGAGPGLGVVPLQHAWTERSSSPFRPSGGQRGVLRIAEHGCGLATVLVLAGPHAGEVWFDATADGDGLSPHTSADGSTMGFGDWFLDWLERESTAST